MDGPAYRTQGREALEDPARSPGLATSAFASAGERRLLLPLFPTRTGSRSVPRAREQVAALIRTITRRLGLEAWVVAYGPGPEALEPLSRVSAELDLGPQGPVFDSAEEAAAFFSALAAGGGDPHLIRPRMLHGRAAAARPRHLAALAGGERLALDFLIWCGQLRPGTGLWCADRDLGLRFRLSRAGATFRAHHPVIQDALERRCREEGIDFA
jgi:hypothetical protein